MGPGFLEIVQATDISLGGVGVFIPHGVDPSVVGKKVEIILTLPACRPAHLRGSICHSDRENDLCHIGIQFLRVPGNVEKALRRYVDLHEHRPYEPEAVGG
jgi:c-di-GMP-binding flagellar brake protein YcgR